MQTTEDTPMSKSDWLRAIQAWLDMPEMRETVLYHLNEAADRLEEAEDTLRTIAVQAGAIGGIWAEQQATIAVERLQTAPAKG